MNVLKNLQLTNLCGISVYELRLIDSLTHQNTWVWSGFWVTLIDFGGSLCTNAYRDTYRDACVHVYTTHIQIKVNHVWQNNMFAK